MCFLEKVVIVFDCYMWLFFGVGDMFMKRCICIMCDGIVVGEGVQEWFVEFVEGFLGSDLFFEVWIVGQCWYLVWYCVCCYFEGSIGKWCFVGCEFCGCQ